MSIADFAVGKKKGIWESLPATLIDDADFEWLMIDASHVKVHSDEPGVREGKPQFVAKNCR